MKVASKGWVENDFAMDELFFLVGINENEARNVVSFITTTL